MARKYALLFPGQGSQYVGMGEDIQGHPEARSIFSQADEVLGFPLSDLIFRGPEEVLDDTINTQPALVTTSIAYWLAIRGLPTPAYVAGHSLGEYTALVAAEALPFPEVVRLVRERGWLMKEAGLQNPGAMAAILGLEDETVEEICRRLNLQGVAVANYNCPGQVVISGKEEAVEEAVEMAKRRGARKAIRLAVSMAGHSPLMAPATTPFAQLIAQTFFSEAQIPIVANLTARPITKPKDLRAELSQQLTSPVRWRESIGYMIQEEVTTFLEVGPGKVLTGLVKRIASSVETINVGTIHELESFYM